MQYKEIELDEADRQRVRDLNDKTVGVQKFIESVVAMGERRVTELQEQGRQMFDELAKKYSLDIKHVTYQPSQDGKRLIPTFVNLRGDNGEQ